MKEEQRIYLEIEKLKMKRERAKIVLDKSLMLYFSFLIVAVLGFIYKYIDSAMLNALIITGIIILVAGTLPYLIITAKEEKRIDELLRK